MTSLIFNKIENKTIFTRDFNPFTRHNKIDFPIQEEIVVIYGPNGTGKTSLVNVLTDAENTSIEFEYEGEKYNSGSTVFHVINDQNNRNIITGDTKDFFLGDNIRQEFELSDLLEERRALFVTKVIAVLKEKGISAAKSPLFDLLRDGKLKTFLKDCANNKSKGENYSSESIVEIFLDFENLSINEYEQDRLSFVIADYCSKSSLIIQIENLLKKTLSPNERVREIEENTEAISILTRFHKNQCIVCDTNGIDWERLLAKKKSNCTEVKKSLDPQVEKILGQITQLPFGPDPFDLKTRLLKTIEEGNTRILNEIWDEINYYKIIYGQLLRQSVYEAYVKAEIERIYRDYKQLIDTSPDITDEDYLYIQEIIANSMSKPLAVVRDSNRRLRIQLSNQEFLGKQRKELPLSAGEQNFLSLTFEFLKAKNSSAPIVVIDDPISSFDSIYKNKVAYSIVKILNRKKRIVLTHNTDLIRLLDNQYKKCFKIYLLNNTDGELNGFIPLRRREEEMLISLDKLLEALRNDVPQNVTNKELFLVCMIPFMRGYANIANKRELFERLTQVMHGYKTAVVDIASAYIELFGNPSNSLPDSYNISVPEILSKTVDGLNVVNSKEFPLLNRTLKHSFTYLFLRLKVERTLVEKFKIDTDRNPQLGQIISAAFPNENDVDQIRSRIRLTSKKTLINEFNHFEGNLSIFQPAIDITDQALGKERTDIISFIEGLQTEEEETNE